MDLIKNYLFSTRLMAVLFIAFAVAMALGTFIESWYSTETARIWIYNTSWFEAIMLFFMINFIGNIAKYRLLRKEKLAVLVLHLAWIFIILGAFVTRYISFEGMMPIREGVSEKVFYSDKTYLTLMVDGEMDGQILRRNFQDDILVTPQAIKSSLPWKKNFDQTDFKMEFVDFRAGMTSGIVADENGEAFLKIVTSSTGSRDEHYIKEGTVENIHNVLFAFNSPTDGAINISLKDGSYSINSPFEGSFLRMADQYTDRVVADQTTELQLRSLYNFSEFQFVIPEPIIYGKKGIVKAEMGAAEAKDAVRFKITVGDQSEEITVLGQKGMSSYSEPLELGGLKFTVGYGSKVYELPFAIHLKDFIAEKYPGTEKGYSSFMSKITVEDEQSFDYDIYMNHVLDHKGYRFFQSSFDPDEKGTVLSVNHDWWGTNITYLGYILLYIGMIAIFFFGETRFKKLSRSIDEIKNKKAALTVLMVLMSMGIQAQTVEDDHKHQTENTSDPLKWVKEYMVDKEHANQFGYLVIQDDNGRMKPINTYASELLRKLSRKDHFEGYDANQVFLSMQLNPEMWYNVEFITLDKQGKNDSLRKIIGIPKGKKLVKAVDFFDAQGRYKLAPYLQEAYATNTPNQFQKDFREIDLKLGLLNRALSGEIVKVFPLVNDENNKWISDVEYQRDGYEVRDSLYANFVKNGLRYYKSTLYNALNNSDYQESNKVLEALKINQKQNGAEVMPSDQKIDVEIRYNKADPFNRLYHYNIMFGVLMFLVLIFQIFKDRKIYNYAIKGFAILIGISFLIHTLGLGVRWYISGHAPWSDAYESVLYVSWATLGMGLYLGRKSPLSLASATFVASMLLWIAHQSWVDPSIANLQPVLDSYWLMIHVAIIVGSYGPLSVGMIIGFVTMILMLLINKNNQKKMELNIKELTVLNELSLTVGLVMLTIGNFLGGMWANESWGRYWGWDPKETWALISIMIYAFVIHARLIPGLRGKWTFSFMSVIAYASIMMTYFGVNFYLSGLHSYASGDQVITPNFIWYTLGVVLLLGVTSYLRYRSVQNKS
jgi:cytochrome c-type biogenesis protein CcsB